MAVAGLLSWQRLLGGRFGSVCQDYECTVLWDQRLPFQELALRIPSHVCAHRHMCVHRCRHGHCRLQPTMPS